MNRVEILNLRLDNLSMTEFLRKLESGIVFTPNIDHFVKLQKDEDFIWAYNMADYKVCDSQLIVHLSRLLGTPIKERISGSDLFPAFCQYHKYNQDIKIFLLGAAEGVALKAKAKINAKIGREIIIDAHSPSFGFEKNEEECQKIIDKINHSGATVLAVGVGSPKQEIWIAKYKDQLPNIKIIFGIGATIDFEAGNVDRAPKWMSDVGMEWLYRLLSEPKRLWKRYLVEDPLFFWLILQQKINLYRKPFIETMGKPDLQPMLLENAAIIKLPKHLSVIEAVKLKENFHQLLKSSLMPSQIILDFSETDFIDSSGIGALVSNYKEAREERVEFLLRGVTPPVMAVLEMTGLHKVLTIESLNDPTKTTVNLTKQNLPKTHPSIRSQVKRSIDIVGAIVGLVITAILFIPIAIAIKIDSPGPIFFSQIRCGWMGKRFRIWKFRSMFVNAEQLKNNIINQADGKIFKNENDPRITVVGRFLRKTSLDELPQFWNVLKGDMSLVGTRPPTPNEVLIYEIPEWQRLDVKPGMTGEWQVNGRSKIRQFEDIIKLDLRYQTRWSLIYDIQLILRTLTVVFQKESGAA
jgi:exopolysaccharide biosynthesis WecB/TagA/CpsF family protein/anti-anti-sigma factor